MRRQILPALVAFCVLTVVVGLAYPLAVTGVAQVVFRERADGSLVRSGDTVVGSSLVGQGFTGAQYFHPRPSAAGDGYDTSASGASNLGPTNPDLVGAGGVVAERAAAYRAENRVPDDVAVPVDAVTASGSGLDPEISVANAGMQVERVAAARGMAVDEVRALVAEHTRARPLGVFGEVGVNVLELNVALDAAPGR
ncbi:MAG: K(+)-transporting ATPase subunit C [Acidimicrobiia bacterium]|nr:K(+)-transporting ATPase subunit C [Acidimicrobiia bacterium]